VIARSWIEKSRIEENQLGMIIGCDLEDLSDARRPSGTSVLATVFLSARGPAEPISLTWLVIGAVKPERSSIARTQEGTVPSSVRLESTRFRLLGIAQRLT
jgi:hypothetical protein